MGIFRFPEKRENIVERKKRKILNKIKMIVAIVIIIFIFLLLIGALLGWLTDDEVKNDNDIEIAEQKEKDLYDDQTHYYDMDENLAEKPLSLGTDGLFRTIEDGSLYAALDEEKFQEYIKEYKYDQIFNKDYGENEESYKLLKELVIRLTAYKYPNDVKFALNKTVKFEEGESKTDEAINNKVKEIKNAADTETINGGIILYREVIDDTVEGTYTATYHRVGPLTYSVDDKETITEKQYCLTESDEIGVLNYEKMAGGYLGEYSGKTIEYEDYQQYISTYIMPMKFMVFFYQTTHSDEFIEKILDIIENSYIELTVFENTTINKYEITDQYYFKIVIGDFNAEFKSPVPEVDAGVGRSITLKWGVTKVENWAIKMENIYKLDVANRIPYDHQDFHVTDYSILIERMLERRRESCSR